MSLLISDAPENHDPRDRRVHCHHCPSVGVIPRGAVVPPRWEVRCTPSREYVCDLCVAKFARQAEETRPQPIGIFAADRAQCDRCHRSEKLPADGTPPDGWQRLGRAEDPHPTWRCPFCATDSVGAVRSMRRISDRRANRRR